MQRRKGWQMVLGLAVSAALLAWVVGQIEWPLVRTALAQVRPAPLLLAVSLFTLALVARAQAWRVLLGHPVPLAPVFWSLMVGFLFTTLLPFRLGEAARVVALHRSTGVPWSLAVSSVAVARLADAALLAFLVLSIAPRVWQGPALLQKVEFWLVVALMGGLSLWLALRLRHRGLQRLQRMLPEHPWSHRLVALLGRVLESLAPLEEPRIWVRFLGWKGLTWGLLVLEHWVLLRLWFPQATLLWSAWVVGVASLGVALPAAPGHVGVVEAGIMAALQPFGVDPNRALALALVKHLVYLGVTTLLGLLGVGFTGTAFLRRASNQ